MAESDSDTLALMSWYAGKSAWQRAIIAPSHSEARVGHWAVNSQHMMAMSLILSVQLVSTTSSITLQTRLYCEKKIWRYIKERSVESYNVLIVQAFFGTFFRNCHQLMLAKP